MLIIQLTLLWLIVHSIDHATIAHSIDQLRLNHSIGFCSMPVITRSQAKLLGLSTEFSEDTSLSSLQPVRSHLPHSSTTLEHSGSLFKLRFDELINLLSVHRESNRDSIGTHFEILKFQHRPR
jgi:hypothetical protein